MSNNFKKLKKYQLTYPFVSNKIYESRNFDKAVDRCYKEFKHFNDIQDGMFIVTDIDNNMEYRYRVKEKKIKQIGGDDNKDLDKINNHLSSLNENYENIKTNLDNIQKYSKNYNQDNEDTSSPLSSLGLTP